MKPFSKLRNLSLSWVKRKQIVLTQWIRIIVSANYLENNQILINQFKNKSNANENQVNAIK